MESQGAFQISRQHDLTRISRHGSLADGRLRLVKVRMRILPLQRRLSMRRMLLLRLLLLRMLMLQMMVIMMMRQMMIMMVIIAIQKIVFAPVPSLLFRMMMVVMMMLLLLLMVLILLVNMLLLLLMKRRSVGVEVVGGGRGVVALDGGEINNIRRLFQNGHSLVVSHFLQTSAVDRQKTVADAKSTVHVRSPVVDDLSHENTVVT